MFDNIKPINPKTERLKRQLLIGIPLLVVVVGLLYYEFKNYAEERQVKQFLGALQAGDYEGAYRIWQPTKYYTFKNFEEDWGPQGEQGPITSFKVTNSHARGSGVIVDVQLNGHKHIKLWVEKRDKSLSFPP